MKKFLMAGVILSVMIGAAGCQEDSLKASYFQSRPELAEVVEPLPEEETGDEYNPETDCAVLNPHPIAQGMEQKFDVSYDEIMTWYCDGYAFSDILLALETEKLVEQSAPAILSRLRTRDWDEIWDELGVNQ